ncbi:MAG: hypothetical protein QXP97_06055 [Desulfurococcus sp.]|uniref:hypothetical protein n=2 Tax=Desulfurococcus sp. TaxID=51678 RepID=UPI00316641B6
MKKSVSETVSTIILTSLIVGILLAILPYTYNLHAFQNNVVEYMYYRQVFVSIANILPLVLQGGEYEVSIPSNYMSVGYTSVGMISLFLNSSITPNLTIPCNALMTSSYISATTGRVYGVENIVVNDTRLIPLVREKRINGSQYLLLDTCRVYLDIEITEDRSGRMYYYRFIFYNLTINYHGEEVHSIRVRLTGEPLVASYNESLYNLTLVFNEYGTGNSSILGPFDLTRIVLGEPLPGIPLKLDLYINNILVEVS